MTGTSEPGLLAGASAAPQQETVPSARRTQVESKPAAISSASSIPGPVIASVDYWLTLPDPSCPYWLPPQHETCPDACRTQVWLSPTETSTASEPATTASTGPT